MRSTNMRYQSRRSYPNHVRRFCLRVSSSRLRRIVVRVISFSVILTMVANSALAAPVPLAGFARECGVSLRFWAASGGLARLIQGLGSDSSQSQEKQSDRDTKVASIQILPGDVTIDLSDRVSFSAVAYDQQNSPVGGVRFKW